MGNWVLSINKEVTESDTICNQQSEVWMTKVVTKVITKHLPFPGVQWLHILEKCEKVNNSNKTDITFIRLNHTTAYVKARSNQPLMVYFISALLYAHA